MEYTKLDVAPGASWLGQVGRRPVKKGAWLELGMGAW